MAFFLEFIPGLMPVHKGGILGGQFPFLLPQVHVVDTPVPVTKTPLLWHFMCASLYGLLQKLLQQFDIQIYYGFSQIFFRMIKF